METRNIFSNLPEEMPLEVFEDIVNTGRVKIERIISHGHSSPADFWYDQEKDEWVLLLQGTAGLLFEDGNEVLVLKPGDWIHIPAHRRHRVQWTDPGEKTIWLAVHY